MSKNLSEKNIKGIEICLTKLYCKLPLKYAKYIIAETNDLVGLNGFFKVNKHLIVKFKSNDKEKLCNCKNRNTSPCGNFCKTCNKYTY